MTDGAGARLNARTLVHLSAQVGTPTYDRSQLTAGIVHIGVGGFHRAHMAMTIDRMLSQGVGQDWAICGVGLLPGDRRMKDILEEQDHLYTLVVRHPDGTEDVQVIGSVVDYLLAPDDPNAVVERMAAPTTKIVSLTVTEGGYNVDRVTGRFDTSQQAVARDVAETTLETYFGLVVEALRRRRDRGIAPFTVLSCDNIEDNGDVAAAAFHAYASAKDPEFAEWLRAHVSFPNSMVDRITPVTTREDVEAISGSIGVTDAWPVVCEPFFQWVIEDDFGLGRPPWEGQGVQMVPDVRPYELMKLRLLNAGHQALCYFGYLMDYRLVHDATNDPLIAALLARYMDEEATPTLAPVPGVDLDAYKRTLIERFSNAAVADTIARLCAESSDRIPKWLVPVVREQLRTGGSISYAAAIIASWARYAEGTDEHGAPIDVVDPLRDELVPLARRQRADPSAFIANQRLFGGLADDPRFLDAYLEVLRSLHEHGARETLRVLTN
ncbi:mannitol dehydrogenase family protein [uncultured Microbacterium sp.]|uniref:mannitol dehydrogenase family protein n=1 Tax=uncultured Microbacterium sp. TaxID=191216 RepID=UPI0028D0B758|nr:mannitol dehydrogenase family protein [uncultured Microbacterium sp.]